jgi:hypothetical protein
MHIRFQCEQQFFNCRLIEDRDVSYRFKCRHDLRSFSGRHYRSTRTFLKRDLFIGIDADHEHVAQFAGTGQVSNVSDVKHVETAVGKNYLRS